MLASLTDSEKSVKNLVTDANLRLAGLLLPHQRIGEEEVQRETSTPEEPHFEEPIFEEPEYYDQMIDGPCDVPIIARVPVQGVNIREPSEDRRCSRKEQGSCSYTARSNFLR